MTLFVDRDRKLADLMEAVSAGERRIWIGGGSGFGKTELLVQLVTWCRERGLPYHWLAPHEPATPSVLREIVEELAHVPGSRDRRRLLVIDGFAPLRTIELWFVEHFLPALPASVTVIVADRAEVPVWRVGDGGDRGIVLRPLADPDARRYLALRGVADGLHAEILALAEGIPAILTAVADAISPQPLRGAHPPVDESVRFYTRHASDDHRLAIAVLVAARTTPYEILELAFDNPRAARNAFAWLSRLSVVDHTPSGLRPHTVLRKACERELAEHAAGLWAHARRAVRVFAEHRIAMAHEPIRWVLDRLFVDRTQGALREYLTLPAGELPLALAASEQGDRAAIVALASAHRGDHAAAVIARWLDDDRAVFDVLRDHDGDLQGYLCSVVLGTASQVLDRDPVIELCVAYLCSIDWFGPATPPDARSLVFLDWTVAGTDQAPSPGAALLIAQMACRLLTTPAVDFYFVVTDRPERWARAIRFLGLEPRVVGEHRWVGAAVTAIVIDLRRCSIPTLLQSATNTVAAIDTRTSLEVCPGAYAEVTPSMPPDDSRELALALERRIARLAKSAALSPREQEVLALLLLGRNNAEVGLALQITPRTARFHQHNVLEKIGAESRLDILRLLL